jgi:hypothetical protein
MARAISAAPAIHCEKSTWDFGTIPDSASVTNRFLLENRGNSTLSIGDITTGCSCTAATLTPKLIPADQTAELVAVFNPAKRSGHQYKTIRLITNDPKKAIAELVLTGTVQPAITTLPSTVTFNSKPDEKPIERELILISDQPIKIKTLTGSHPAIHAQAEPIGTNKKQLITLKIDPARLHGRIKEELIIETTHPKTPIMTVPILGRIK